jgi:hypothetical protein
MASCWNAIRCHRARGWIGRSLALRLGRFVVTGVSELPERRIWPALRLTGPKATHRVGKRLWKHGESPGDDYGDDVDAVCTSSQYVHSSSAMSAVAANFNGPPTWENTSYPQLHKSYSYDGSPYF